MNQFELGFDTPIWVDHSRGTARGRLVPVTFTTSRPGAPDRACAEDPLYGLELLGAPVG